MVEHTEKTTPKDVSEFEREQLSFFLSSSDMASTLTELNPSLAWLPILAEMNLLQTDAALPLWVEQNFASLDAVREVVANLHFFKLESAAILEHRLNSQRDRLDFLPAKCWELIIRHIRNNPHGRLQSEWFQLLPRLKRGDLSTDVLGRIAEVLTPKLFVGERYGWYDLPDRKIEKPTDVISIKYDVDSGVSEDDFFASWPVAAPVAIEGQLIHILTNSLGRVLADAMDVDVESNVGLSISDVDVPSVAAHEQNSHHSGFLSIVRITAELWLRLIEKNIGKARSVLREWQNSDFRLLHRLALYAAAHRKVPPGHAADVLIHLPQGELFLTSSRVEVHRLIRKRWPEFSFRQRSMIEKRIVEGPPTNWFRDGTDLSQVMDQRRFPLLLDLERTTVPLGDEASTLLKEIRDRHPQWRDVEPEKAGFVMWQGGVTSVAGNKNELASVPSNRLVQVAKQLRDDSDFMKGDPWQALCQDDPSKAFLGISDAPTAERWHEWAWRPFLWAATKITDTDELNRIATLLAKWPKEATFEEASSGAAWWMDQVSEKLKAPSLWALWDLVEQRAPRQTQVLNNDPFGTALNDASGHLASVLLKRTPRPKDQIELGKRLRTRYEKLIGGGDLFSLLARVTLSASIAFLFERAPKWTTANILPSFDWDSPDASAMWSARKYSNHIGSAELFRLVKKPFLDLFLRPDTSDEDLRQFSDWLGVILIANQTGNATYPLAATEVRSVLRRAGRSSLSTFAHRLAIEMESASPEEKPKVWRDYVGPVFQGAWPLDVELQTPAATFKLVQILLATGPAFREAATVIMPFIRPEDPRKHASVFAISQASPELYRVAPKEMLDLLSAVAGDAPDRTLYGLDNALNKLKEEAPHLVQTRQFQNLAAQAFQA
jgi:hypothetical protein